MQHNYSIDGLVQLYVRLQTWDILRIYHVWGENTCGISGHTTCWESYL